mgnify:CR=1 FL=1
MLEVIRMSETACVYDLNIKCLHPCDECEWYNEKNQMCCIPYYKICPHKSCQNNKVRDYLEWCNKKH